jgi:5'(3')-deoxyribonucleotidase
MLEPDATKLARHYEYIYLDMDEVLTRCARQIVDYVNAHYQKQKPVPKYLPNYRTLASLRKWSIHELWPGITKTEMWAIIDAQPGFWETMDTTPWATDLIAWLRSQCDNLRVLTAPPVIGRYPGNEKRDVLVNQLGIHEQEIAICCDKGQFSQPDRLLIDDAPHNINAFLEAKNPGHAALVSADWNCNDLTYNAVRLEILMQVDNQVRRDQLIHQ